MRDAAISFSPLMMPPCQYCHADARLYHYPPLRHATLMLPRRRCRLLTRGATLIDAVAPLYYFICYEAQSLQCVTARAAAGTRQQR